MTGKTVHSYSHRVAVSAYVLRGDYFLLLKRANPPLIWGPPGGRLLEDENPVDGLRREVMEESGLQVEPVCPVDFWFGSVNGETYLSLDYLVRYVGGDVSLSEEHSDFRWSTMIDLREGRPALGLFQPAFLLADFERAWDFSQRMMKLDF